jgi:type VI protein secretion system component Hcp
MPIFLKIPNVAGESTAIGFTGQFKAEALLWGGHSVLVGGVKPTLNTTLNAVSVSKSATINSPTLMLLMMNQKNLGSVVITITKDVNTKNLPAQVYTLSGAYLSGYSQASDSQIPSETLTFVFSRITYQQIYYTMAGVKTGEETHYWDVVAKQGG